MPKADNETKGTCLAKNVVEAQSLTGRLKGLLGKKELPEGEGMLLKPCYQIHTWFMKFPIDAVFMDRDGVVLHLVRDMKPFRMSAIKFGSASVLELKSGVIQSSKTEEGDRIIFRD